MRFSRWAGVVAFAAVTLSLTREAHAKDDAQTLAFCDAAAAVVPVAHLALLAIALPLFQIGDGTNDRGASLVQPLPYTVGFGATIYALCSPFVHLANRRPLQALGSLAVRIGGPLAGVAATYGTYKAFGGWSWPGALMTLGAVPVGIGSALAVDYMYLTPVVQPTRGGATGGLAVTF